MQGTLKLVRDVRYRRGPFAEARARADAGAEWAALLGDEADVRRILERFVLAGATAKSVASELNVSLRQFYRLYTRMLEMLDAGLRRSPAFVAPATSKTELELEHARTLLMHGRWDDAQTYLSHTLASRPGTRLAIAAMLLLAGAQADRTDFEGARATIERAMGLVGEVEPDRRLQAVCRIAMAQSYVAYAGGFYSGALAYAEESFERGAPETRTLTHHEVRALARDRIYLGVVQQEAGDSRRAMHHFREALSLLRRLPTPPGAELSQAYVQLAIAGTAFADDVAESIGYAEEGLRIAQWHGLRHEEVWAHLALGMLQMMSGRNDEALRSGETALGVARAVLKGDPMARALFVNNRLQIAIGSPARGLQLLDEARPHVPAASLLGGIMEICQARTHQALGDADGTVEAAGRAIATMESRSSTHYIGIAYWARGAVRLRRGDPACKSDAERAIHYLERGAVLPDYANALELSAAATANARHADLAREVRAAMRA